MAIRVTRLDVFKCSIDGNFVLVFRDGSVILVDNIDGVLYPEERKIKEFPDSVADIICNFYDRFDFRYMEDTDAFVMYKLSEGNPEQIGILTRSKLGYNLHLLETSFAEELALEFLSFTENELGEKSFVSFSQFVQKDKEEPKEDDEQAINLEFSKDENK